MEADVLFIEGKTIFFAASFQCMTNNKHRIYADTVTGAGQEIIPLISMKQGADIIVIHFQLCHKNYSAFVKWCKMSVSVGTTGLIVTAPINVSWEENLCVKRTHI